jgi:hypothetical protein
MESCVRSDNERLTNVYNVDMLETQTSSLLEAASPETREDAIRRALAPFRPKEQAMLVNDPVELGFRAEAVLAGVALDDKDDSAVYDHDAKTFARIVPPVLRKLGFGKLRAV